VSDDEQQSRASRLLVWLATILPLILLWLWLGRPLVDRFFG
jgi:predicted nucleic acid-binding Zn ribbon protein